MTTMYLEFIHDLNSSKGIHATCTMQAYLKAKSNSDDELRFMYENGQGHLTLFCIVFVEEKNLHALIENLYFSVKMADNPWFVDSLQNFWHLKCPECTFDSKEEGTFKYHAVTKHPLSLVLFGKEFNYPVENPTTDLIKIEISKEEPKPVDKSFVNENYEFNEEYDIDGDFDDNFTNANEHTEIMENCTSVHSLI